LLYSLRLAAGISEPRRTGGVIRDNSGSIAGAIRPLAGYPLKQNLSCMKLSLLAVLLGTGVAALQIFGLLKPAAFAAALRRFPRSVNWGYFLMALGMAWFLYYLSIESISDFEAYKPYMYLGFGLVGVLTCIYVSDFLAVRGLAIVLMLLGKFMIDTARWNDSDWRFVILLWAYLMVAAGIWFTVSPWRLRDLIGWAVANERRIRLISFGRLAFGLFVVVLGLLVL
jgi:hypothetical protein